MKFLITTFVLSVFSLSAFAQSYDVKVETYVGGKLEDKFSFVIKGEDPQEKGFDGKYLAKRYLAKGFENTTLAMAEEAKKIKEQKEIDDAKTYLQKAEEMLLALTNTSLGAEKRVTSANAVIEANKNKVKALEEIIELGKSGSASAKAKFEAYMSEFGPSKQDLIDAKKAARLKKIKYQDFEEYDIGSFCRMRVLKVLNKRTVRFNISYAYSRLLATAYHDGKNTDNAITKYPIFEIFERLNTKAKITLGKPYCIQFARPSSTEEAKTIQDAIAQTRLFSGMDASIATEESNDETEQVAESAKKSPLDVKGSYEKIKDKFSAETASTLRAVFTVTAR